MDEVSLVETIRHRIFLRAQGLQLPNSKCSASLDDLIQLNYRIISGNAGWAACCDLHQYLEGACDTDRFMPWLGAQKLRYEDSFDIVVPALCNAWKRLVFPYETLPWTIFAIAMLEPEAALAKLIQLHQQSCCNRCQRCCDPSFALPLFKFVLPLGEPARRLGRVQMVQKMLKDVLRDLPASTVQALVYQGPRNHQEFVNHWQG